ncbi:very large low complexity protein [Rutstroemia sp. NJR-2017a WRK4]|nr:very large low complexity protein [Rutstroemia sp. NJR-2017a WRK4]
MQGMVYEMRNDFCEQQLHFRMHGSELVIRSRRQQQICEVIPMTAMLGDFPMAFIQDYVHWWDQDTQSIEWRPLKDVWASSADNWQMHRHHDTYILSRATKELLDIRSPTFQAISHLLSPLEHATHIHVFVDCQTKALEIHLPRMKLDFHLKDATSLLESKQFRGMVVDDHQSFGAFTGLVNKLVLRDSGRLSRCVIIPEGDISFEPKGPHVQVTIDTASAVHVKYHSYQIDSRLGRLVDNGSLPSRLFRLYLHATTSHCLVDQLTGRTGTEEALYGLESAATRSFVTLEPKTAELLKKLARLTPQREYYPEHLEVMQQVEWNGLSPLAQHCAFYTQVASILDQATSFQIFQEQPTQLPVVDNPGSQFLLERAAIRDSSFQVCGFGAGTFTAEHDTVYSARDQIINSERELNTYHTAKLVDEWSQSLQICPHLLSEIESWVQPLSGHQLVNNPTFGFDLQWLDLPSNILSKHWCTFHEMLSNTSIRRDKYRIMMLLSTLSYSQYAKQELVQTLLAFATIPELRELRPPRYTQFQLSDGYSPDEQKLTCLTEEQVKVFHNCPESKLPNMHGEKEYIADGRRSRMYESAKDKHVRAFVSYLISQWPTVEIYSPPSTDYSTYILVEKVMEEARACFKSWNCNSQFRTYIQQTQAILDKLFPERQKLQRYSFSPPIDVYIPRQSYLKFSDLTKQPNPCLPHIDRDIFKMWNVPGNRGMANIHKLQGLLDDITARCSSAHERRYTGDLLRSFEALNADSTLEAHLKQATHDVENMYQIICDHLKTGTHSLIRKVNMLPRISPISLLQQLASDKVTALPDGWKESLVQYGLSITALQRAERLLAAAVKPTDLLSELENPGHQDWNPMHHPEWLLMEIENEIMIRQEQAQISREMMVPSSGSNSVMQLNMGLGKSSVIVPIIAAALADKTKLVRVVVLKPLAMQMFQSLVKKLGGMVNRRVVYMPISRSLNLDVHQAAQIQHMYEECKQTGSIVLVQPEHILSFELMGLERVFTNPKLGGVMLETQHWLQTNSRDILDESDEILSVRFELIYTMGMQRAIEFSPERWLIIQHVLGVLNRIAPQVHEQFPHGLEVIPAQAGGFSRIRILQAQAGVELLKSVSQQLCEKGLPGVNMWNLSSRVRGDLFRFITDSTMGAASAQLLLNFVSSSNSMKDGLLLLRGLFAYGTLSFAFEQKRWRVNYGLDPSRTKLAVPYHAKDSPAARAEFSHPDVTIVLTCLSYYYGGLSDQQLRESFEALLLSDHAQEEYEQWVRDAPCLSSLYKHLTGVNLMNSELCSREVFPPLRFAKSVVDFYISAIVFPVEMKEFPQKLSSSGWDIAQEKAHPTTGFSGTNDSRYVLPLSISQCDLPEQLSTNAVVLGCLLRPENTFIDVAEYSTIGFLNAEVLLKMVSKLDPPVRVVLDVGAQVLELSNEEFAGAWLSRVPEAEAQAVIFFDACNEVYVLSRDRRKEPFQISPFAKQMDQCLVYLDESHTRGTDLKLPDNYRAIVTLGPGLTKDRLVQACMRMRKLGKGQSVVLCSSMEVQRKILEYSGKNRGSINVVDVLAWCIAESCANTRKSIPLWATQGLRHQNRQTKCSESAMTPELVESLLEPEAQSLQQRYGYEVTQHEDQMLRNSTNQNSTTREQQVNDIRAKCQEFEIHSLSGATLQEEQERELSPENEREQQVELPPKLTPRCHSIHKDVRRLIADGVLDRFSDAFQPAFKTLGNTTAHAHYEATAWPDDLLVTADFAKTVCASDEQFLDSFLRPVHWIVSCKSNSGIECVILSPHEAQELLPLIRKHKQVILHVYSPRLSVSMRSLENLSFCAIPAVPVSWSTPAVITQLNLFAGQLYIRNNEDYMLLCDFLGLCNSQPADHIEIACDGFIGSASRALLDSISLQACLFQKSPIPFVRAIMTMRRKGQSIAVSHIGRILNGELITIEQA